MANFPISYMQKPSPHRSRRGTSTKRACLHQHHLKRHHERRESETSQHNQGIGTVVICIVEEATDIEFDLIDTGVNMDQVRPIHSPAADTAEMKPPPKNGSLSEIGSMAEATISQSEEMSGHDDMPRQLPDKSRSGQARESATNQLAAPKFDAAGDQQLSI